MPFLEPAEMNTHIYGETVTAISQGDTTFMPQAIAAAIIESQGYLMRFDTDDLFSKTGDDRDPFLLLCLKNQARWHFIPLANPNIDYEDAKLRYEQAIKWLDKVERSRVVPPGWKLVPDPLNQELDTEFKVSSERKRKNRY